MGFVFNAVVYVSGYVFLLFVAVCLACGLYYLAELVEEHTAITRRIMYGVNVAILASHVLFLSEGLPYSALAVGLGAHSSYMWLLQSFPFLSFASPPFLTSFALFCLSNFLWITHFLSHFHQLTHVLCFMLWMVWLVPFGFFISLSANESTLPNGGSSGTSGAGLLGGMSFGGKSDRRDV